MIAKMVKAGFSVRRQGWGVGLYMDGIRVGCVWRYPKGMRHASKYPRFGLHLDGWYWRTRDAEPNKRGGCTARAYPRQRDAIAAARLILEKAGAK